MGPFDLGGTLYRALAVISLLGRGAARLDRRAAPERQGAVRHGGTAILLAAGWWLGVRRFFRGPPATAIGAGAAATEPDVVPPPASDVAPAPAPRP